MRCASFRRIVRLPLPSSAITQTKRCEQPPEQCSGAALSGTARVEWGAERLKRGGRGLTSDGFTRSSAPRKPTAPLSAAGGTKQWLWCGSPTLPSRGMCRSREGAAPRTMFGFEASVVQRAVPVGASAAERCCNLTALTALALRGSAHRSARTHTHTHTHTRACKSYPQMEWSGLHKLRFRSKRDCCRLAMCLLQMLINCVKGWKPRPDVRNTLGLGEETPSSTAPLHPG